MAQRLIGSGTTDSQGKININYTGTGAGKLQLIAKQGNLTSDTFILYDALFNGKSTTTGWSSDVELENNRVKWTVPATSQYVGCYDPTLLADAPGNTITTTVKISSEKNVRLICYYYTTTWTSINSILIPAGTTEEVSLTSNIPVDATRVWCRLQANSTQDTFNEGDVIYIDEFYIYIG